MLRINLVEGLWLTFLINSRFYPEHRGNAAAKRKPKSGSSAIFSVQALSA
jgi:hypothetical protein